MEFSLYIGYNDVDCDVRQEIPGRFASDIVIQHHDMIVTGADVGLKVRIVGNSQNLFLGASRDLVAEFKMKLCHNANNISGSLQLQPRESHCHQQREPGRGRRRQ